MRMLVAEKKKAVKVMMPPRLIKAIKGEARRQRVSMNELIRMAVTKYLANLR
ncbi:ribbon-helix-helix protein, CopG family [Desulfofundulus sp. TPOSR]|uniref:ribbon-helix-helix protein, CopG family n=1 Tax=Desulfofundulus sp. TPOSR TaxID=2714340 RepID=UPI0014078CE6|nr:ribbon-helix-helix protein, CopG family [Desulfofundulus sp. TPOSR]NHM25993.1 ribbon-helix-helix protein, CopG family [Desulfofundulus sp. TPOSR]